MRSRLQSIVLWILAAIVTAAVGLALFAYVSKPLLLAGPMVQLVGEDGFSVVWWVSRRGPAVLEVDVPGRGTTRVNAEWSGPNGRVVGRLTRLERNATALAYRCVQYSSLGIRHVVGTGRTLLAPKPSEALRFVAIGDTGSGKPPQYDVAEMVVAARPQLVIHTGDVVYPSGSWPDYMPKFFIPYESLLRDIPMYPSLGNHDMNTEAGKPYLEAFELPDNGPAGLPRGANYWFDFGPARFAAIDTNAGEEVLAGRVAPWLGRVMAEAPTTWRFVFFHHPPYTNGKNHKPDDRVRRVLVPVLERTGVDVVFNGHNHLFERTKSIREGRVVPDGEGVFYVVTGAGGHSLYAELENPPEYIAAFNDQVFSFTTVEVSGETLRLRQIDRAGEVLHEWTYVRPPTRSVGAASRPSAPATAPASGPVAIMAGHGS